MGTLADSVAALGLQSAHGYHAGSVRQQLIQSAYQTVVYYPSLKVYQLVQASGFPSDTSVSTTTCQVDLRFCHRCLAFVKLDTE